MTKKPIATPRCYYTLLQALKCNSGKNTTQLPPACPRHPAGLSHETLPQPVANREYPNPRYPTVWLSTAIVTLGSG